MKKRLSSFGALLRQEQKWAGGLSSQPHGMGRVHTVTVLKCRVELEMGVSQMQTSAAMQ